MSKRDSFLLRIDPLILDSIRRWAQDDLRSVNGQLEFLLRRALREAGRLPDKKQDNSTNSKRSSSDDAKE